MIIEPIEAAVPSMAATRDLQAFGATPHVARLPMPPAMTAASPAAFDEIFARLDRAADRPTHSAVESADVGSIPKLDDSAALRLIDPAPFRGVAAALERQYERLTSLLLEIESGTATE